MRKESVKLVVIAIILSLTYSCDNSGEKSKKAGDITTLSQDNRIEKRDLFLDDIADVEYISLESNDRCLMDSPDAIYISDDKIVIEDYTNGKQVFFYMAGNGKWINTIDKHGQGPGEYQNVINRYYDNENNILSLLDYPKLEFKRYNDKGDFVSSSPFPIKGFNNQIINQDNSLYIFTGDNMPYYKNNGKRPAKWQENVYSFFKVNADTGEKSDSIYIPKKYNFQYAEIITKEIDGKVSAGIIVADYNAFFKDGDKIIMSDIVSDTVYTLEDNMKLIPWATKEQSTDIMENRPLLNVKHIFPNYIFYNSILLDGGENSFETKKQYLYNRKTGETCEYTLYLREFGEIPKFYFSSINGTDNTAYIFFDYSELSEAMEKGELSGKLLELTEKMSDDDNPILVKIKFSNKRLD